MSVHVSAISARTFFLDLKARVIHRQALSLLSLDLTQYVKMYWKFTVSTLITLVMEFILSVDVLSRCCLDLGIRVDSYFEY